MLVIPKQSTLIWYSVKPVSDRKEHRTKLIIANEIVLALFEMGAKRTLFDIK